MQVAVSRDEEVEGVIEFQIRTSRSDTNAHTNTLSLFR